VKNRNWMDKLGAPHIELAGLRIWIHGRQFANAADFWDANWLRVTAQCEAQSAVVKTGGSIIHLSELVAWLNEIEILQKNLLGQANLDCMEPELSVYLVGNGLGHIAMKVEITPDHLKQAHEFEFEIDQTYLTKLAQQCRNVLAEYPLKYAENVGK